MITFLQTLEDHLSFMTSWQAFLAGFVSVGVLICGIFGLSQLIDAFHS